MSLRGAPRAIRVDNGPEFISKVLDRWTAGPLDRWAYENEVKLDFSRPGKPTDMRLWNRSTGGFAMNV